MGYIYKIINDTNDLVYIGQTVTTIQYRWKQHLTYAENHNTKLAIAIKTIGKEHFSIQLVEECEDSELNSREVYWISYYDSYFNGYNMTQGGGYWRHIKDDELNKQIFELWDYGYGISDISNELKLSYSLVKNRIHTYKNYNIEESIKRGCKTQATAKFKTVYQWDQYGNLINIFPSLQEASIQTNTNYQNLSAALRHCGSTNNYIWTYENKFPQTYKNNNRKKVAQYDLNNNLIKIYASIQEASKDNNADASGISKCCRGVNKTCKNYIWKYVK